MVQDIQQQIKHGEIAPVYVFCGKETYLLESALQQLVDAIAPGGENAFNLERVNGAETNLREIVNLANMLPFFAQRKLLIVEDAPWFGSGKQESSQQETEKTQGGKKSPEVGLAEFLDYLEQPSPSTCLVFLAGEKINRVKKITKAALKYGTVVDFQPLKGSAALHWLDELLQQKGKKMSAAAKQQLLLSCDYQCALAAQEVEKLACYVGEAAEITAADMAVLGSNNTTTTIFHLVDEIAAGHLEQSLRRLEQVLLLESEFMIVPILSNHFLTMFLAKNMKKRGYQNREIMLETGKSHPFIIEKALRQGMKYSEAQLQKILEILLQADKKSKLGICSARDALETAIIQICFLTAGKHG